MGRKGEGSCSEYNIMRQTSMQFHKVYYEKGEYVVP